jgi:hypothetical protein
MVVSAKHVDALIKPSGSLVLVVGDVTCDVGSLTDGFDYNSVAVVTKSGGTQPDCTVLLEDVALVPQYLNRAQHLTGFIE